MPPPHDTNSDNDDVIVRLPGNLTIRRYRDSDAAASAQQANNINVANNLRDRFPHPYTEADARSWIEFINAPARLVASGPWDPSTGASGPALPASYTIALDDVMIGSIGLEFGADVYFRSAEVGYWIGESYWGRGLMSRVVEGFVAWAWRTFGVLLRLNAETSEANLASGKVLSRAGFQVEGVRPKMFTKKGVTHGVIMWGLLRPEEVQGEESGSL